MYIREKLINANHLNWMTDDVDLHTSLNMAAAAGTSVGANII